MLSPRELFLNLLLWLIRGILVHLLSWTPPIAACILLNWAFVAILAEFQARPLEETTKRTKHIRSGPPPELPFEIYQDIVNRLEGCPQVLRHLTRTSRRFNALARPIQFRTLHLLSIDRLVQLNNLIWERHCTIPHFIDNLVIRIEPPQVGRRISHTPLTVATALSVIHEHFEIKVSLLLDLHWMVSRQLDWSPMNASGHITKFSLHGTYACMSEIPYLLNHLRRLESLVLDATFLSDSYIPTLLHPTFIESLNFHAPNLKEVAFSPACLVMMAWMSALRPGPSNLHVARITVDRVGHGDRFTYIRRFMETYGSTLKHLYVSIVATLEDSSYEDLGEALRHAPNLRQLELLLLYADTRQEMVGDAIKICRHMPFPGLTVIRVRGLDDIGVDGKEYWEEPFLCIEDEACRSLRKLSSV